MNSNFKQLPKELVLEGYKEGYEKQDGTTVFFAKDGSINILEECSSNISLEELTAIYKHAQFIKANSK